jgi:hypothetical protein
MVSRQTAIIALVAAVLASAATLSVDRIVLHADVAAELRHEAAQRQSEEAEAVRWMTQAHAPGSPLNDSGPLPEHY